MTLKYSLLRKKADYQKQAQLQNSTLPDINFDLELSMGFSNTCRRLCNYFDIFIFYFSVRGIGKARNRPFRSILKKDPESTFLCLVWANGSFKQD